MMDRKAYLEKMEAQLREWKAEVDAMSARADKARADAKIELNRQVSDLRTKYDRLRERFEDLKTAGEKAYDKLREGFEAAVREFTSAFERTSVASRGETATTARR